MSKRLAGKTAIVTGGARGIGLVIARRLATEGASMTIMDILEGEIEKAVQSLKDEGLQAEGFVADVTSPEQVEAVMKEIVAREKRIDILVNNAGITRDGLLIRMKEKDWDLVMNVNLKGTFLCTQKALRYMMKARSGVILNISSVIGEMGNTGQANYAASKAGIIAFTKSTAKEFAGRNIRANAIAPGFIETEMTATLPEDVVKAYSDAIPLSRMGTPEDIASLCVFLASDEASYITGQTIRVDGGLIMA